MVQGLFIVFLSAIAFGMPWGDPLAAGMVVVVFLLELAVLGLFALGLVALGTWRFRRVLSR